METTTITLAFVGAKAIEEGIKFLYGLADDLIKRYRDRRDAKSDDAPLSETEPVEIALPAASFAGQLESPQVHFAELDARAEMLDELAGRLRRYENGMQRVDMSDKEMLATVDALRREFEAILGQTITFQGEKRPPSGSKVVLGEAKVEDAENVNTIGVDWAGSVPDGAQIGGRAEVTKAKGGSVIGTKIDNH